MNKIEVKLSRIVGLIGNDQDPWEIVSSFDEMTLSYTDVAENIVPFLDQLSEIGLFHENDNDNDIFLSAGKVLKHFMEKKNQ